MPTCCILKLSKQVRFKMSVYRCNRCENYYDADYEGCFEDKTDPLGMLCCTCDMYQDEDKNEKEI